MCLGEEEKTRPVLLILYLFLLHRSRLIATLFYFLLCQPHLTFHSKDKSSGLDQQHVNLLFLVQMLF